MTQEMPRSVPFGVYVYVYQQSNAFDGASMQSEYVSLQSLAVTGIGSNDGTETLESLLPLSVLGFLPVPRLAQECLEVVNHTLRCSTQRRLHWQETSESPKDVCYNSGSIVC